MKSTILLTALAVFNTLSIQAEILTVDNRPGSVAMFSDFGAAHAAATDGDTIILAGTGLSYGSNLITKTVNIIGPGNQYDNLPSSKNINSVEISLQFSLTEDSNSSGSTVSGVSGQFDVFFGVNGIQFRNCWFTNSSIANGSSILIDRCYIPVARDFPSGTTFKNSIILGLSLNRGKSFSAENCVFVFGFGGGNQDGWVFRNSILSSYSGSGATLVNTIVNPAIDPFEGGSGPAALRLNNSPDNPAKRDSIVNNLGAFGGETPFTISADSHLPRLKSLTVTPEVTPTSGLRIQLEAVAGASE